MLRAALALAAILCASPVLAQMDGLTHHGVPDFCASPTKTASTGNWNTAGTWTASGVPGASAIVVIPNGVTVTYDKNDISTSIKAICIESGGTLTFGTSGTLALLVGTLVVEEGGTLLIGNTETSSQFTGTLTISFDDAYFAGYSTLTSDLDPAQWNTGLIVAGKIRTYGVAYDLCVRAAANIAASATTLTLGSTPTGWASGETLLLPESRQRITGSNEEADGGTAESETRTLSANVTTTSATISSGTTYAHPPAYGADGSTPVKYPHVCNVSGHNIKFTSETPAGTRGHTIYLHRADVKIYNASFIDLGRTTISDLNCSLRTTGTTQWVNNCVEGSGAWTTVGTNQKGRYAVHFHHLYGPADVGNTDAPTLGDAQSEFVGNLVYNSTKWPFTLHNTAYSFIQGNAFLECDGPCVMGEDGHEFYNVLDSNIACVARSNVPARGQESGGTGIGAREAAGYWFTGGSGNTLTNNVACAMHNTAGNIINEVGYKMHFGDGTGVQAKIPNFRGADLSDTDEYVQITARTYEIPNGNFDGNECYAMTSCMTIWELNTNGSTPEVGYGTTYLTDMIVWHVSEAFFPYPVAGLRLDGWTQYCNSTPLRNDGYFPIPNGLGFWSWADYAQTGVTLNNISVYNCNSGVTILAGGNRGFTISNSYFKTDMAVLIAEYATPGGGTPVDWPGGSGEGVDPGSAYRTITISNVTQAARVSGGLTPLFIRKLQDHQYSGENGVPGDGYYQELPDMTYVVNDGGFDYELYYDEQESESDHGGLIPSPLGSGCELDYRENEGIACNVRATGSGTNTRKPRRLPVLGRVR